MMAAWSDAPGARAGYLSRADSGSAARHGGPSVGGGGHRQGCGYFATLGTGPALGSSSRLGSLRGQSIPAVVRGLRLPRAPAAACHWAVTSIGPVGFGRRGSARGGRPGHALQVRLVRVSRPSQAKRPHITGPTSGPGTSWSSVLQWAVCDSEATRMRLGCIWLGRVSGLSVAPDARLTGKCARTQ